MYITVFVFLVFHKEEVELICDDRTRELVDNLQICIKFAKYESVRMWESPLCNSKLINELVEAAGNMTDLFHSFLSTDRCLSFPFH